MISISSDHSIKFWDLDDKYCFKTLEDHKKSNCITVTGTQDLMTINDSKVCLVWRMEKQDMEE